MTTRFIKPKYDKYIQLYSKYAKPDEITGNNGSLSSIILKNNGQWYEQDPNNIYGYPTVSISAPDLQGGVQATAVAVVSSESGGYISEIQITEPGSGYTSAPTVNIIDPVPTGGYSNMLIYINVTNGGSGYTSNPTITVSGGGGSGAVVGDITIEDGVITEILVTNGGSGYTSAPTITISGGGGIGATAVGIMTWGFGATALASITIVPEKVKRYVWELEDPVEINENAIIQVVDRVFTNVPSEKINDPITIRMHEISTKSVVNTINNSGLNSDFYLGKIIDIGKPERQTDNDIKFEIQPQNIQRIALSLNHGISDNSGVNFDMEFVIILKIKEKEPDIIEYGSLNNINVNQI